MTSVTVIVVLTPVAKISTAFSVAIRTLPAKSVWSDVKEIISIKDPYIVLVEAKVT